MRYATLNIWYGMIWVSFRINGRTTWRNYYTMREALNAISMYHITGVV